MAKAMVHTYGRDDSSEWSAVGVGPVSDDGLAAARREWDEKANARIDEWLAQFDRCPSCAGRGHGFTMGYLVVCPDCQGTGKRVYLCTVCQTNAVDAPNGYDTCADCLEMQSE